MKVYKDNNGNWQELIAVGHCERHGDYPLTYRRWLGNAQFGARMSRAGCPECIREAKEIEAYGQIAVPVRFQGKTIDGYVAETAGQKEVKQFFQDYVASMDENIRRGCSIILLGNPGTGKTHLACALVMAAKRAGKTALFTSVAKTVRSIRETWNAAAVKTERQVIDAYTGVDLLVLDEVGVQSGSENEQNLLFAVLNERYECMRPTVLISNLNKEGVEKIIGDRAMDRLRENGGKGFIFDWPSYRLRATPVETTVFNSMPNVFEFEEDAGLPPGA
jgi:DNA replication protein DnaC|nr:MAG TPA_asm: Replicative helicase [Caudoviricetes sp.]